MKNKESVDENELAYWLALIKIPGIGNETCLRLIERYSSIKNLFHSSIHTLKADGLNDAIIQALKYPNWNEVEEVLEWKNHEGHHIIQRSNELYPPLLKEIKNAPLVLFIKGDPAVLSQPQLSIVGSRNPTPNGKELAWRFARECSSAGLVITSGLALGIDSAAHRGCLSVKGRTIAVMGTGLDRIYPTRHHGLAEEISENGALVSEFFPQMPPRAEHFPRRNRIISGLSCGTLVVEAAIRSGSLITARYANEQGREVFAIPGSIYNPLTRGNHLLIRQGAKLTESIHDILEEFIPILTSPTSHKPMGSNTDSKIAALDKRHKNLLKYLEYDPLSIEQIIERSKQSAQMVTSLLLELELAGIVAAVPSGYQRVL